MTSVPITIAEGPIDVHAHLLAEDCYDIPGADGTLRLVERENELHLGDFPIRMNRRALSDPAAMVEDMDSVGIAVRIVAPPPYAFALDAPADQALSYARQVNEGVASACSTAPGRLLGLGMVPAADLDAAIEEMARLSAMPLMVGLTIPPLVNGRSFESEPLRSIGREAGLRGLPILVHPMQQMGPGLGHHYLQNLLGNPTESAAAIAALLLSGLAEEEPDLRIAFVHGGGCASCLLGRWDHGWRTRSDVRSGSRRLPSETFRDRVYVDLLTHDSATTEYLTRVAGQDRLLLGSDYPWDMGVSDPVAAAERAGVSPRTLTRNARVFLFGAASASPVLPGPMSQAVTRPESGSAAMWA